jgi:hypothetical protein
MKTKKDNELHHLIQFKQVFERFPDGEIFEHECPDFIVDNGNRKVGIEVTKIFKAPRSNEPPMQAVESACKKIADFAQKICEERQIPPLIVSLHFIQKPNILNIRRDELSYKIADFVCSNIPNPDSSRTFEDRYSYQTFPEYIHAITIGRFKVLTKSHFNVPTAGWAQREFSTELQQVIDLKNPKIVHYNDDCEEHWLIIISEGSSPSSFFECNGETREAIFKSEFDRSFFMEAFSKSWWELKTFKAPHHFLK